MNPPIIPFSHTDLERRRLETTIDQDLHSLSLSSLLTTTASTSSHHPHHPETSFATMSSLEYARGDAIPMPTHHDLSWRHPDILLGPHGTPRAGSGARKVSRVSEKSMADSPVSTVGHHVSAVTLAEGVFRRHVGKGHVWNQENEDQDGEWDPERSFGRLVGELGKAMGGQISARPTSPFSPIRSPRSPSPFTSVPNNQRDINLSFTLNRNDPLPSPPHSRSASGSGSSAGGRTAQNRTTVNPAQPKPQRKVLGESNVQNMMPTPTPFLAKKPAAKEKDRVRAIQDEMRRPKSAPARSDRIADSMDVTGMTGLMETPAKGGKYDTLGKNGDVGPEAGAHIPESLATLHARLRALETENSVSRRRVRELEFELENAQRDVERAKTSREGRLREVIGEKSALEELVKSLHSHLARLTEELENHKSLVADLRAVAPPPHGSPLRAGVSNELRALRKEVERLGNEVARLGSIVEQGLETRKRGQAEKSMRQESEATTVVGDLIGLSDEDAQNAQRVAAARSQIHPQAQAQGQPSKLRQGLHQAAATNPTTMPPSHGPAQRQSTHAHTNGIDNHRLPPSPSPTPPSSRASSSLQRQSRPAPTGGPSSPFPSIRHEDEDDFFQTAHVQAPARVVSQTTSLGSNPAAQARPKASARTAVFEKGEIPPQTVLARVIRELEADFAHYKAIYGELAEQYKVLDAASVVAKRHILAEHLKEVIDTLEQKADQISALYDLLSFQDKPVSSSETITPGNVKKSVLDVVRMVRESLGEDGLRRLQEDGVIPRRS